MIRPIVILACLLAATTMSASAQAPQAVAPKATDRIAAAAAKAGIKRCAPIIKRVAEFLIEDGDAGFRLKSLGNDADTAPVTLSLETRHKALGTTRYSTIMIVPQANCSGYYEQSIFWPMACPDVKANNFANFPPAAFLHSAVALSEASQTVQLALMPAGAGCMSVKKEIFR